MQTQTGRVICFSDLSILLRVLVTGSCLALTPVRAMLSSGSDGIAL